MKCHCGAFYDCQHCEIMSEVQHKLVRDKLNNGD